MKAFSEKCDNVLLFLNDKKEKISWRDFFNATHIRQNDAIVSFLKNYKGFVEYDSHDIEITQLGRDFISTTSFVKQRDSSYL